MTVAARPRPPSRRSLSVVDFRFANLAKVSGLKGRPVSSSAASNTSSRGVLARIDLLHLFRMSVSRSSALTSPASIRRQVDLNHHHSPAALTLLFAMYCQRPTRKINGARARHSIGPLDNFAA